MKLADKKIIIVAHIFASGPALELEEFLKPKVKTLLFIGHPFTFRKDKRSFYRVYKEGGLVKEDKKLIPPITEPLVFIKESIYTFYLTAKYLNKADLYIGSDNFSAYVGLLLKKLGLVKQVVLYTIDYVPDRFKNPFLNRLYRFFDEECLKGCKIVWNVSERIAEARNKFEYIDKNKTAKQITVPLGIWYDRISKFNYLKRDKNTLIFVGHLLEKQGLQIVIKALKNISEKIPDVKLIIIGEGPYKSELKKQVGQTGVAKYIKFAGYVESHEEVEQMLSKASLGIATYKPDPSNFTYFADPGKIKNYLAAGLPVIVTDVPQIAGVIEKKKCGVITGYNEKSVADAIIKLLSNRSKLVEYSSNAKKFASNFDWNKIFSKAIASTL